MKGENRAARGSRAQGCVWLAAVDEAPGGRETSTSEQRAKDLRAEGMGGKNRPSADPAAEASSDGMECLGSAPARGALLVHGNKLLTTCS